MRKVPKATPASGMMMPWKVFFQPSWATRAKLLMIVIWLGTMSAARITTKRMPRPGKRSSDSAYAESTPSTILMPAVKKVMITEFRK